MSTSAIIERLEAWQWSAAVFGLGYVGLPLSVTLARAGIDVAAIDINDETIQALHAGHSHIDDVPDSDLNDVKDRVTFTTDAAAAASADVIFLCVPTPLALGKQPDVSFIEAAARAVAAILRPGQTIILESTTFPGTTDTIVRPILESSGLAVDKDFLLAFSPERVDPGNEAFKTANIARVVGGVTPDSTQAATLIYSRFVEKVHPVRDARTAEMTKLLENTFRWVNIGLANEMSFVARALGVDIWEVIEAAATKPFGFMPFTPGAGVGGHCIPLDPFYLRWAAELTGEGTRFVELAQTVNSGMPAVVVDRVQDALNNHTKPLKGSKVLVLGVAYKSNIADSRESPALDVIRLLAARGANVSYADPHVPALADGTAAVDPDAQTLEAADCVVLLTDHDAFDYERIANHAPLVFDARNAFRRRGITRETIIPL